MKLHKIKSVREGFTLVEVIVATFITLIVLTGMLSSYVMGRYSASLARHRSQAIQLVQDRMEKLKGMSYDALDAQQKISPVILEPSVVLDGGVDSRNSLNCGTLADILDFDPTDNQLDVWVYVFWNERTMGVTTFNVEQAHTIVTQAGGN